MKSRENNYEESLQTLTEVIKQAVDARSDEGVVALSGGVDSALVAALSDRPCIAVGIKDSHDLKHAAYVSEKLGLFYTERIVTTDEIEEVLPVVVDLIPGNSPLDLAIGTTLFFIAETAKLHGHRRILTGQGADEIFGGYARYEGKTESQLEELFISDFESLKYQGARDQAIASYHNTYLSYPYLDEGVVCAARSLPVCEKVIPGIRKKALRDVAAQIIPSDIAYYDKKAMQYGSGIWKEIKHLAKTNGYQSRISDFIDMIRRA